MKIIAVVLLLVLPVFAFGQTISFLEVVGVNIGDNISSYTILETIDRETLRIKQPKIDPLLPDGSVITVSVDNSGNIFGIVVKNAGWGPLKIVYPSRIVVLPNPKDEQFMLLFSKMQQHGSSPNKNDLPIYFDDKGNSYYVYKTISDDGFNFCVEVWDAQHSMFMKNFEEIDPERKEP
jgi:hypothetical protein